MSELQYGYSLVGVIDVGLNVKLCEST